MRAGHKLIQHYSHFYYEDKPLEINHLVFKRVLDIRNSKSLSVELNNHAFIQISFSLV